MQGNGSVLVTDHRQHSSPNLRVEVNVARMWQIKGWRPDITVPVAELHNHGYKVEAVVLLRNLTTVAHQFQAGIYFGI